MGIAIYEPPRIAVKHLAEIVEIINAPMLLTVGDYVSYNVLKEGLNPEIVIIDEKTRRKPVESCFTRNFMERDYQVLKSKNPPGTITRETLDTIRTAFKNVERRGYTLILVEGEEDLVAFPVILYAPPRSVIAYGLWRGALVAVIKHPYMERAILRFFDKAFEVED